MTPSEIKALFEQRQTAVAELRALHDSVGDAEPTAEQVATEQRMNADIDAKDKSIKTALTALERNKLVDEMRAVDELINLKPEGSVEKRNEAAEFTETLRKLSNRGSEVRSLELGVDVTDRVSVRDLVTNVATDGQELIPVELYNRLIEHLVRSSPILSSGVQVLRTAGGNQINIPRTTAYSTATLIAEAGAIGESDPQFEQVRLDAYKLGFATQASTELLQDNVFNLVEFLTRQGGQALGRKADEYFAIGTGSSQPEGLINVATGKTTASATAVTSDEVLDLIYSIIPEYRTGAVFYMNDNIMLALRKLKDTTGQYIWAPGMTAGAPSTLFGYPVYNEPSMDNVLTTGKKLMVFGNPNGFMVRFAGGVRIDRSDDYAFLNDLVTWRFLTRIDSVIVDANALRKLVLL